MNTLYWSVRRELWENRSIYLAPLIAAGVGLFGFSISTIHLKRALSAAMALDAAHQRAALSKPYDIVALLIMGTSFIVGIIYCLEALHGERRDRSILFWKSLPVSDATTVIAKALIPLVALPLINFVVTVAAQWLMALISSAVLLGSGLSVAALWGNISLFQTWVMLLYHLVAIHALWYAPIYGWLLLVSSWAKRAVFLWAGLPLMAIGGVEKIAFNTSYFAGMLQNRISVGSEGAFQPSSMSMDPWKMIDPVNFLSVPGLWIGLAVTALFLAAAVRIRRYREPI